MRSELENDLVDEIHGAIKANRWTIAALFPFAIVVVIAQCSMMYSMAEMRQDRRNDQKEITANSAKIDAAIAQMLVYQQQTVQYWDELSNRNPKIIVPKAIVTAPGDKKHLTEDDLRRPTVTPSPTPKVIIKYKRKPSPTPYPFKWPWQH